MSAYIKKNSKITSVKPHFK